MACVTSVQVHLSIYKLLHSQKMLVTCQHAHIQTFGRLQTHNLELLTCSFNHPVTRRNIQKQQKRLLLILQTCSKLVSLMEKVWWVCEDRPLEQPLPDEQELLSESESESLQLQEPLSEPCTQLHTSGSQSSRMLVKCVSYHNKVLPLQNN